MTATTSIWAKAAMDQLANAKDEPVYHYTDENLNFELRDIGDSLWLDVRLAFQAQLAFRIAYAPGGFEKLNIHQHGEDVLKISLSSALGEHQITIERPQADASSLHYTTVFQPSEDLFIPYWPRDILAYLLQAQGEVHIAQAGTRTGLLFGSFKDAEAGNFLYSQHLTSLADYNTDTGTSAGGIVGGQWPEMGLSLPPAVEKPLIAGKSYTIADAFICFDKTNIQNQFDIAKGFLSALERLYLLLPRPETIYREYLDALPKALHDLQTNKGCWSHRSGHAYLNAYLCDYQTPPEIMVQLAVLLPVQDYMRWSGQDCQMAHEIGEGLAAFFNQQLGTLMRWLPSEDHRLDGSEEQKKPMVMDSWYLHHPLLNLTRMAIAGDGLAQELLLKSVDYAIKVARHFNYSWPVFYHMETLEVIKAETKPGEGGEKDVAGLYAHVMLQLWELTGEQKYFQEAENAAQAIPQHGFNIFYQANNTMFGAKAMVLLYKETKRELYRDLAYLFLANIFKNVALWECNYGFGKNFPTFFELFPLGDAPYTAVYEEQEAYAGVHEFLSYADGVEIMPAVRLLLAEFVRYVVHRLIFYYPPMLPPDMLVDKPKTGELDTKLWIALEDIHDGWEQSGEVGQEVYGAGLAFGIVPRQYIRLAGEHFMVYTDYPVLNQKFDGKSVSFELQGDARLTCRLKIIHQQDSKLPEFEIKVENPEDQKMIATSDGMEWAVHGNQKISISWN